MTRCGVREASWWSREAGTQVSEWWVDILHTGGREEKAGPFDLQEDAQEAAWRIEDAGATPVRRGGKSAPRAT